MKSDTVIVLRKDLERAAPQRWPGYIRDVENAAIGVVPGTRDLIVPREAWEALRMRAGQAPKAPPSRHPSHSLLCPRCGQPMQGGCRRSCRACGYSEGCGG